MRGCCWSGGVIKLGTNSENEILSDLAKSINKGLWLCLQETLRSCVLKNCAGLKHVKNSTGAKLEASLAGVGNGQECAVLGVWLCPQASHSDALFPSPSWAPLWWMCVFCGWDGEFFCLILMKCLWRLLWGALNWPFAPRPTNKTARWLQLTSGNQKARCLLCELIHEDVQRAERRAQSCPSVLQNFPVLWVRGGRQCIELEASI